MGFTNGDILLDSPTGAYYSGQMVNGRLVFDLDGPKKLRVEHTLSPGHNEFPFSFQLPDTCPSSFEASNGHVRYELRCVMDIPYAIDEEKWREIRVHAPLDLNMQNCNEPVNFEFDQSYCCWCIGGGSSHTVVKIPANGFCPGQTIPIEVYCQNRSTVEIDYIKFAIKKEVTFTAKHEHDTRSQRDTVVEQKKGPVAPHTDRRWDVPLLVPDVDVHNLNACSFIDITYELKVTVSPSGCHDDDTDTCELILGTIPLREMQMSIPAQQINQINSAPQNYPPTAAPYPQPVVTQPTLSPYPQNTPYPVPQPYPTPIPYPNSPQPGASPYPQPIVTPYPQPGMPAQPQPGVAPYPQPGIPPQSHPGASPYPVPGVPPHAQPGAAPYLQPGVAPYPQVPNPHVAENKLVKSTDPGFVVGGPKQDEASVPLLPMGTVPYPLPRPASPYANASAPAPTSTPDKDTNNFDMNINSSPYNPAFMNAEKKDEEKKE